MFDAPQVHSKKLESLIADVMASGGAEMANAQLFVMRLTEALALPQPDFAKEENRFNDYVFERAVAFKHPDGTSTTGRIDCYRRGSFILEAKQSAKRVKTDPAQTELLPLDAATRKLGHAKQGTRAWDKVMAAARKQAEDYARALPVDHGYPPFLLIVDVGHVIEIYADFSGQGKNYAQFPDRQSYRLTMEDLRGADVQARLAAIWTDPLSLDPAKKSAEVTRDIAERLANIAKRLEGRHDATDVAEFLMRCLFTMFAEDVGLLPEDSFEELLGQVKDRPEQFVPAMEHLWKVMDEGGYEPRMMAQLKRFNGGLFKSRRALPLDADGISELYIASKRDWRDVEPAIFGTLLERALDPRERSKLGAHYTPRAYVERLVIPTIIEPLRADWEVAQSAAREWLEAGKLNQARKILGDFHHQLCTTRVLDPACGTGNFLYVSLELMKKLEGEVLEALEGVEADIGLGFQGETVNPAQFYGLELNPRAVPIADLVLWIGYIKWQLRTVGLNAISEPVLHAYGTIKHQDAILNYDSREPDEDDEGKLITVWDGRTMKVHPITSKLVPDESARSETYRYTSPREAHWPSVDFIVGNPPFIGNKLLRKRLGRSYVDALYAAYADLPSNIDFVMYWWAKAARLRQEKKIVGFGFVTTNSIRQVSNRQIIGKFKSSKRGLSIDFAIPDHPWVDDERAAAVRVSMTAVNNSEGDGALFELTRSNDFDVKHGVINSNLTIGVDVTKSQSLKSNTPISFQGCKLGHVGFLLDSGLANSNIEGALIRYFYGGDEIKYQRAPSKVIDACNFSEKDLQDGFPYAYQHLLMNVKPYKDTVDRASHRENWWRFGEPRPNMREALNGVKRYIVTVETSKHRFFTFIKWPDIIVDGSIIAITVDRAHYLSVLSSRTHAAWSLASGGRQGKGNDPRYQNSLTFDPFPFPACVTDESNPALRDKLAELGERLDTFRKQRLAEHGFLTMTGMYNVLERIRELDAQADVPPLTDAERDIHEAGLISVLKDIHDEIERATFEAYGWSDLAARLVGRPGATMPSPHKSADQEAAEEELLSRLVALNVERQAEEARGQVRWLRPDYQIAKLGHKVAHPEQMRQDEAELIVAPVSEKPKWPTDAFEQVRIVKDVLSRAPAPALPDEIEFVFDGRSSSKRKARVGEVLRLLTETGGARSTGATAQPRYFVAR